MWSISRKAYEEIVGIVSKGIQRMQLAIILYLHVLHQMYRINEIAGGKMWHSLVQREKYCSNVQNK